MLKRIATDEPPRESRLRHRLKNSALQRNTERSGRDRPNQHCVNSFSESLKVTDFSLYEESPALQVLLLEFHLSSKLR